MAEIKRPNYFTSQFLIDRDFIDEQSYRVQHRRRQNRVLHSPGVAEGFGVTRIDGANGAQVQIGPGSAIDSLGREVVLQDPLPYTLLTAGTNIDVFLTIAFREVQDPADRYTAGGVDNYTRFTERPLVADSPTPPTAPDVITLARIRLNASGAIDSNAAIDTSVRPLASGKIAPRAIGTSQLADGGITLSKLAAEARPTAAIVDTLNGTNRIVTQINAGSGVIARARVEPSQVSGVVVFSSVQGENEQFSDEIDPGLGAGPLRVQLARETTGSTTTDPAAVRYHSRVNRANGTFRIHVSREDGLTGPVSIRWSAFKVNDTPASSVSLQIAVSPLEATLRPNIQQAFVASVANATDGGVTWEIASGQGTFLLTDTNLALYRAPASVGERSFTVRSRANTTIVRTVPIHVSNSLTGSSTPPGASPEASTDPEPSS